MRRIFLQSTQKAWVKLVKNTQVHYTELYYRLQNEGSGDWWDLREKFLGISGYSSRMPALWFLAYFSYVNFFSMEMHTFGVIKNVMTCVMNIHTFLSKLLYTCGEITFLQLYSYSWIMIFLWLCLFVWKLLN